MNTTIVVSGLITNAAGKVLMAKRRHDDKPFAGMWEIPGGKVNKGPGFEESERAALVRELREELGVEVAIGSLLSTAAFHWEVRVHLLLFECLVDVRTDGPQQLRPLESNGLEWVHPEVVQCTRQCLPSLYSWYPDIINYLDSGNAWVSKAEIDNG